MRHGIPEKPARRDSKKVRPSASKGLLNDMDASPSARKARTNEIHGKAGSISKIAMARKGQYDVETLPKAGVGANRPRQEKSYHQCLLLFYRNFL